jgi:hypothetical protein
MHLKFLAFIAGFVLFGLPLKAQFVTPLPLETIAKIEDTVSSWSKGADLQLNFSNVGLHNWAAGGVNSMSVSSIVNLHANYDRKNSLWENRVSLAYGRMRQGDRGTAIFKKTDDNLILISRYSQKIRQRVYLTAVADFRTQMDHGYVYERIPQADQERRRFISEFMAPGFLTTSLGFTKYKKDFYSATFAPLAGKFTFVLNDSLANVGAFGVEPGQRIRSEAGVNFIGTLDRRIMENVRLKSNINLFANYQRLRGVDVNWEATLFLKVNKYITSSLTAHLIYDEDILVLRDDGTMGQAVQFRHVINLGLALRL